jgi:glyoxylase-like metal-dependent hydrolase (beta-lactamase superfamily II)
MAFFETLILGQLSTNCYIFADGSDCFVIDPGAADPKMITTLRSIAASHNVSILLTHTHSDHFIGADLILSEFPGSYLYVSAADKPGLFDPQLSLTNYIGDNLVLQSKDAVRTVSEGSHLQCGSIDVEVIETPGHTVGGVIYVVRKQKTIFSGDTLFLGNVGRTDLPGGNAAVLRRSIADKIFVLPDDFGVFPGHGAATTVRAEKSS